MNILEKLNTVLGGSLKLGFMPDKPDNIAALFEYNAQPYHWFGGADASHAVQLRVRAAAAGVAYDTAETLNAALDRYHDNEISVTRTSEILDIGADGANPPRREYTINYTIREL